MGKSAAKAQEEIQRKAAADQEQPRIPDLADLKETSGFVGLG